MSSQHANRTRRLAVIPSDPIQAYVDKGTSSWLEEYYNPERVFDEVYALSPLETRSQVTFGMHVIPTTPEELPRRLMELQIDVVRAYGGYWPCDFATSGNANGIPVIVSVHDTNPALLNDSILAADEVLAVSNAVAQLLRDRGVPGNRITVFGNRVNLKMFTPMRDPAAARDYRRRFPGKYSILHVGRKTPQKNLDTLLRALATLGEDFTLVTIGRGDSAVYQDLARQLHVDNRCEFLDSIPNESLPFFYSNCDVMCTPSRYEGFGLVFIEALACAAVVVTSDIDPLNTLIRDHETGILVKDFENPAALYALIQYLFYNRGKSLSVMMSYSYQLKDLADWYRQLWAESLGKNKTLDGKPAEIGPTPIKALGTTDQQTSAVLQVSSSGQKYEVTVDSIASKTKVTRGATKVLQAVAEPTEVPLN